METVLEAAVMKIGEVEDLDIEVETAPSSGSLLQDTDGEAGESKPRAVKPPIKHLLQPHELFMESPKGERPNVLLLREHLAGEGRVSEVAALKLVAQATEVFRKEPNLLPVATPVTIVGDIHGQYYDLLKLTSEGVGGNPEMTQYLFLGDYVDRGQFSVECLLYLFALKVAHPKQIWMIRGNHECRHLTAHFSFRRECLTKQSERFYQACCDAFNCLPLAALVNRQFLCVHGGISPSIASLRDIEEIQRNCEPPSYGPMCDLLWADPTPDFGQDSSEHFSHNRVRGCSFSFTYAAVVHFLERNGLFGVIRAHEAQAEGFKLHRTTPKRLGGFPALITVFSAPNYLDVYKNKGAVIKFLDDMTIRQFNCSPHPYWLPNFTDVFSWSLPFLADKTTEIMERVLEVCTNEELLEDEDDAFEGGLSRERKQRIRNKIQAVGRIHRSFSTLRQEEELVLSLKGLSPGGRLPQGILSEGGEGLRTQLGLVQEKGLRHRRVAEVFQAAKEADSPNERRPPDSRLARPPLRHPNTPLPVSK